MNINTTAYVLLIQVAAGEGRVVTKYCCSYYTTNTALSNTKENHIAKKHDI